MTWGGTLLHAGRRSRRGGCRGGSFRAIKQAAHACRGRRGRSLIGTGVSPPAGHLDGWEGVTGKCRLNSLWEDRPPLSRRAKAGGLEDRRVSLGQERPPAGEDAYVDMREAALAASPPSPSNTSSMRHCRPRKPHEQCLPNTEQRRPLEEPTGTEESEGQMLESEGVGSWTNGLQFALHLLPMALQPWPTDIEIVHASSSSHHAIRQESYTVSAQSRRRQTGEGSSGSDAGAVLCPG